MSSPEIRYYKGRYKVEVLKKSKGNYLVLVKEKVPFKKMDVIEDEDGVPVWGEKTEYLTPENCCFVTVPRLLWKKPKL